MSLSVSYILISSSLCCATSHFFRSVLQCMDSVFNCLTNSIGLSISMIWVSVLRSSICLSVCLSMHPTGLVIFNSLFLAWVFSSLFYFVQHFKLISYSVPIPVSQALPGLSLLLVVSEDFHLQFLMCLMPFWALFDCSKPAGYLRGLRWWCAPPETLCFWLCQVLQDTAGLGLLSFFDLGFPGLSWQCKFEPRPAECRGYGYELSTESLLFYFPFPHVDLSLRSNLGWKMVEFSCLLWWWADFFSSPFFHWWCNPSKAPTSIYGRGVG